MKTKTNKMKRKIRKLYRRICVGLRASAHLDDTIKGRRDKFGPTLKVATAVAAVAMASAAQAGDHERGLTITGSTSQFDSAMSSLGGAFNEMSAADKAKLLTNLLQGKQASQVFAEGLADATGPADAGQVYSAPGSTYSTAIGALGGTHYTTVCDY